MNRKTILFLFTLMMTALLCACEAKKQEENTMADNNVTGTGSEMLEEDRSSFAAGIRTGEDDTGAASETEENKTDADIIIANRSVCL